MRPLDVLERALAGDDDALLWLADQAFAGDFDESKHPRVPAGSPEGGRFAGAGAEGGLDRAAVADRNAKIWRGAMGISMDRWAASDGMKRADFDAAVAKRIGDDIRSRAVMVREPFTVASKILGGDSFKNQFETGTSNGFIDAGNSARSSAEAELFGIHSTDPQDHPVYGTLEEMPGGAPDPGDLAGMQYGDVMFMLNDDVRDRTTWTAQDSLMGPDRDQTIGDVGHPDSLNGLDETVRSFNPLTSLDLPLGGAFGGGYVEAQIHGNLDAHDVKAVYISRQMIELTGPYSNASRDAVLKQLDRSGIPWFVQKEQRQDAGKYVKVWTPGVIPQSTRERWEAEAKGNITEWLASSSRVPFAP